MPSPRMDMTERTVLPDGSVDGGVLFAEDAWEDAQDQMRGRSRVALTWMHPLDFLAVAAPGHAPEKEARVQGVLQEGRLFSSLPYLSLRGLPDNDAYAKVVGHEGRHRARALLDRGYTQMPVLLRHSTLRWSEAGESIPRFLLPEDPDSLSSRTVRIVTRVVTGDTTPPPVAHPLPMPASPLSYGATSRSYGVTEACPCGESEDPEVWLREDHEEITGLLVDLAATLRSQPVNYRVARDKMETLVQELSLHFSQEEKSVFARLAELRHLTPKERRQLTALRAQHQGFRQDMARVLRDPKLAGFAAFAQAIEAHAAAENALLLPNGGRLPPAPRPIPRAQRPRGASTPSQASPLFPLTPGIQQVKVGDTALVYSVHLEPTPYVGLASVRTPAAKRGAGSARAALLQFLAATDAAGLPVTLIASPLDRSTQVDKLVSFYRSLGFLLSGQRGNPAGDPVMERPPRSPHGP